MKIILHKGFDLRSANAYTIKVGRNMVIAKNLNAESHYQINDFELSDPYVGHNAIKEALDGEEYKLEDCESGYYQELLNDLGLGCQGYGTMNLSINERKPQKQIENNSSNIGFFENYTYHSLTNSSNYCN